MCRQVLFRWDKKKVKVVCMDGNISTYRRAGCGNCLGHSPIVWIQLWSNVHVGVGWTWLCNLDGDLEPKNI